jgi:VIT1/CCC1 family predicted Fe2+/Mn2+ transporter
MPVKKRTSTSIQKGIGFGITSGVITTLGLMVGLDAGTGSSLAVIVGIFAVAISDAFSDALGMHNAEEIDRRNSPKTLRKTTLATFFSKLFFTLTFAIPVFLFDLQTAIFVSIAWGLFVIGAFSYVVAQTIRQRPEKIIFQHVFLTIIVIIITYYVGKLVGYLGSFL